MGKIHSTGNIDYFRSIIELEIEVNEGSNRWCSSVHTHSDTLPVALDLKQTSPLGFDGGFKGVP